MDLEINYNNFEVIKNKELLIQINDSNKYLPYLLVHNHDILNPNDNIYENSEVNHNLNHEKIINCECEISDGYSSSNSKSNLNVETESNLNVETESNLNVETESNHISINESNKNIKNKYICDDELSLLEDDYIINNGISNDLENKNELKKSNISDKNMLIKSEFKNILKINKNKKMIETLTKNNNINKDGSKINNNLEKIYKQVLIKKEKLINTQNKQINKYDLKNYLCEFEIISNDNIIKNLSNFIEFLFTESTRGWNYNNNIYILNFSKLQENLEKIVNTEYSNVIIGIIYRDYTNPKVYIENNLSKNWIGYIYEFNKLTKVQYSLKNKILYYCLKNLINTEKFKKKIGSTYYKFFKKTVQIYGNKELIIDIVFYIGIKN